MYAIIAVLIMTGCASTVVTKKRWVECWALCGKADKLVSASTSECLCSNGDTVGGVTLDEFRPFDFLLLDQN